MAGLVVAAVGVGGWFLFLAPKSATIEVRAISESAIVGTETVIEGAITPAAVRRVDVQAKSDGSWQTIATTSSDVAGLFSVDVTFDEPGDVEVRLIAPDQDRWSEQLSAVTVIASRLATTLGVEFPKTMRGDIPGSLKGLVSPIGVRVVRLETSVNQETWTEVASTESKADGRFTVPFSKLRTGERYFRVVADESGDYASAAGEGALVRVENYKVAGEFYLKWIAKTNDIVERENDMDYASFETYRSFCAEATKVYRTNAKQLDSYDWPLAVVKDAKILAQAHFVESDWYNQCARSTSWSDIPTYSNPHNKAAGKASTALRAELGLPAKG